MKKHYLLIIGEILKKYHLDISFLDDVTLNKIHRIHANYIEEDITLKQKIADIIAEYIGKTFIDESNIDVIREKPVEQSEFKIVGKLIIYPLLHINAISLEEALIKAEKFTDKDFVEYIGNWNIINTNFEIHDIMKE